MIFDRREQAAPAVVLGGPDAPPPYRQQSTQTIGSSLSSLGPPNNAYLTDNQKRFLAHPLFQPFFEAWAQAADGKGERHGGDAAPFLSQKWRHIADSQGTGFLTGQAVEKILEAGDRQQKVIEASDGRPLFDEAWRREIICSVVYLGMALLHAAPASSGQLAKPAKKAVEGMPEGTYGNGS